VATADRSGIPLPSSLSRKWRVRGSPTALAPSIQAARPTPR
jgi:hypothetical protein